MLAPAGENSSSEPKEFEEPKRIKKRTRSFGSQHLPSLSTDSLLEYTLPPSPRAGGLTSDKSPTSARSLSPSHIFELLPSQTTNGSGSTSPSPPSRSPRTSPTHEIVRSNYSVAVIGPSRAGKTNICKRILNQAFEKEHMETLEEFYETILKVPAPALAAGARISMAFTNFKPIQQEFMCNLSLHDTGGSEHTLCLLENCIDKCDGFLLVYDTASSNLSSLAVFVDQIARALKNSIGNVEAKILTKPIVILANQRDLKKTTGSVKPCGTKTEVQFLGRNVPCFETTAKQGEGIEAGLHELLRLIHYPSEQIPAKSSPTLSTKFSFTNLASLRQEIQRFDQQQSPPIAASAGDRFIPIQLTVEDTSSPAPVQVSLDVAGKKHGAVQLSNKELEELEQRYDKDFLLLVFDTCYGRLHEELARDLSEHVSTISALKTTIVCVTDEPQAKADFVQMAWNLNFEMISDTSNYLAKKHGVHQSSKASASQVLTKVVKSLLKANNDEDESAAELRGPSIVLLHREQGQVYKWPSSLATTSSQIEDVIYSFVYKSLP